MTARSRRPVLLGAFPAWTVEAACTEPGVAPDWFYPESGPDSRGATRRAREVCARCPVSKDACREYGDSISPMFGVFGGMSVLERKEARRLARETAA